MTNLYQFTVRKSILEDAQAFKDRFNAAFNDIFNLTKLLCESKSSIVQGYIESYIDDDPPWLSFRENQILIFSEISMVEIHRTDSDDAEDIVYDFGKRSPADDNFLLAVMAIFKHHLPGSELGREVIMGVDDSDFDDAVRLATLVNPKVCNPLKGKIVKGASKKEYVRKIINALKQQNNRKKPDASQTENSENITYKEAATAQKEFEDLLLQDPNIVSIGVIAEKDDLGKPTGNYVVEVGVISLQVHERSLQLRKSVIPTQYRIQSSNSKQTKYVNIIVVETGPIVAQTIVTHHEQHVAQNKTLQCLPNYDRVLNIPKNGIQNTNSQGIKHSHGHAGTMGLLLEQTDGPDHGKVFILSNNHILANNNSGFADDPIFQLSSINGSSEKSVIALLYKWVPLSLNGTNMVDAAIAEVFSYQKNHNVSPYIRKIGIPVCIADPFIGMTVEKIGSTTGYTSGQIISINQSIKVNYGPLGFLKFKDQICSSAMSRGGDSGSCLFEKDTRHPIGLLFAGDSHRSYYNPLKSVMTSLSLSYTNHDTGRRTHKNNSDFPFRILTRKFSTGQPVNLAPPLQHTITAFCRQKPALKLACGVILSSVGLFSRTRINTSAIISPSKALKLKL